jgi:hypothetical protein
MGLEGEEAQEFVVITLLDAFCEKKGIRTRLCWILSLCPCLSWFQPDAVLALNCRAAVLLKEVASVDERGHISSS